jgi:hypothetical protein
MVAPTNTCNHLTNTYTSTNSIADAGANFHTNTCTNDTIASARVGLWSSSSYSSKGIGTFFIAAQVIGIRMLWHVYSL